MRIAIAGAGGFATILAGELCRTEHQFLLLSTKPHPELEEEFECQVAVVDYQAVHQLRWAIRGVDLVISTIGGVEQINLIDAAQRERVPRFVPAEFEGALANRPSTQEDDPLDNGSHAALEWLQFFQHHPGGSSSSSSRHHPGGGGGGGGRMRYTVFSCGVFYERFAPGGLGAHGLGSGCRGGTGQGDFLFDAEVGAGEVPASDVLGRPNVLVCMTSAYDVARFVVAALRIMSLRDWPAEFRMHGTRINMDRLLTICSEVRGFDFTRTITQRPFPEIEPWLEQYRMENNQSAWWQMQYVNQVAQLRFYFPESNLNPLATDVEPIRFRPWLEHSWAAMRPDHVDHAEMARQTAADGI